MRLHGRVVQLGHPVEGAYVQLLGPSGDFTAEIRTDESGRFIFYAVEGDWVLRGLLPGGHHLERTVHLSAGETRDVQLVDEQPSEARPS